MRNKFIISLYVLILLVLNQISSKVRAQNLALNKKILGVIKDYKKAVDGIISPGNYAEVDTEKKEAVIILALEQANYVDKINIYWVKGYAPESYEIDTGVMLFRWTERYKYKLDGKEKDGLLFSSHKLKGEAAFFIKISILKSKSKIVRISEIEVFPKKGVKIKFYNEKVVNIGKHSATLVFNTSPGGLGLAKIGENPDSLKQVGMNLSVTKEHKITVGTLLSGTTYYILPGVQDLNGRLHFGKLLKFKTKGIALPRFYQIYVKKIKPFSAEIFFKLNKRCRIKVMLSYKNEPFKLIGKSSGYLLKGRIKINGLIPENNYTCKVIITDKLNNRTEKLLTFTTPEENVALGKKVYGSFIYPVKGPRIFNLAYLSRATDGELGISGLCSSDNVYNSEQILIVDLKKKYRIKRIEVIWRSVDYPQTFNIEVSLDNKSWKLIRRKIYTGKEGSRILSGGSAGLILRKVEIPVNTFARYIKIFIPKGTRVESDLPYEPDPFVQLAEVRIYKFYDYGKPQPAVKFISK